MAAATHLLDWLTARGPNLADCRQPDLDTYLVEHPKHGQAVTRWLRATART